MATIASTEPVAAPLPDLEDLLPDEELLEEDGENLESDWHRLAMNLLIAVISWHFRQRDDTYVGGNMFLYYSRRQAHNRDFRGPDFFVVKGVPSRPLRRYWALWEEDGHYPNVIIELTSPTTAAADRTVKKDLYEQTFRTPEYFLYDPDTGQLQGWRLGPTMQYEAIAPNAQGWLWSQELQLWVGAWTGPYLGKEATYLRFFDANGQLAPIEEEEARAVALLADQEAAAAKEQAARASEKAKAAEERAQVLAVELEQVKARLRALEKGS